MSTKDYDIANQTGICCATQRTLAEGEEFYAVLYEKPDGFERCDYSLDAWTNPPEGIFCFWKSRIPRREEKQRLFVDNEVMLNLFYRLEDTAEEVKKHFRFVLALILMRKRLLKYEQTVVQDQQQYWEMRRTGEDTRYRVMDPRLNDEQIDAVSRELGAVLHGDASAFAELDAVSEPSPTTTEPQDLES